MMQTRQRRTLLTKLQALYPEPRSELNFSNEYELIVAVILSAQCTDKKVNEVTPVLFKKYPTFKDLSRAKLSQVESIIRPVNYYRTKSKNLIAMAEKITREHAEQLPRSREALEALPGVGRKTTNVILCEQGIVPALPVDTHVLRLAQRLGLSTGTTPEQVEKDLCASFPPEQWRTLHHSLIFHGRRVCKAQRPACDQCSLRTLCPTGADRSQ